MVKLFWRAALAPEDKHLLQTAAVIGTAVPFALRRAIADVPASPCTAP